MTGSPHGGGWVVVHLATGPAFHRCQVDGVPVELSSRETPVPVPAGPHRVECSFVNEWGAVYGERGIDVQVPPGAAVPVYYAMPRHVYGPARIGLTPQARSWAFGRGEMREQTKLACGCVALLLVLAVLGLVGLMIWSAASGA